MSKHTSNVTLIQEDDQYFRAYVEISEGLYLTVAIQPEGLIVEHQSMDAEPGDEFVGDAYWWTWPELSDALRA